MSKTFRPYDPRQSFLLPPSPQEWLPEEHLAYFVLDVVETLDLRELMAPYEGEERGQPPYDPRMMLALLVYGYCVGVPSSRKIEQRTYEDVAFRVIACNQHPDHSRISNFRRRHLSVLGSLFVQVLKLCRRAGLVGLGRVALDGTKVKANASRHKAMSYGRMKEDEAKLEAKVKELLSAAEAADRAEDEQERIHGRTQIPEELRRAETRLARIRKLKSELEAEAKQQQKDDDQEPPAGAATLPSHRVPTENDGTPTSKAQRNFTDAESRIQKGHDGFVQGYNCQAAVDADHQIIVAQAVTNQPPDVEHLIPLVDQVRANLGRKPKQLLADSGYYSEANVTWLESRDIDPFIATGRSRLERKKAPRGRIPKDLTVKQRMARKLATKRGAAVYARRKVLPEPVFGQIKHVRGFRQFLMRGLEKVRAEWSLISLTHNLLKLHRAQCFA